MTNCQSSNFWKQHAVCIIPCLFHIHHKWDCIHENKNLPLISPYKQISRGSLLASLAESLYVCCHQVLMSLTFKADLSYFTALTELTSLSWAERLCPTQGPAPVSRGLTQSSSGTWTLKKSSQQMWFVCAHNN